MTKLVSESEEEEIRRPILCLAFITVASLFIGVTDSRDEVEEELFFLDISLYIKDFFLLDSSLEEESAMPCWDLFLFQPTLFLILSMREGLEEAFDEVLKLSSLMSEE